MTDIPQSDGNKLLEFPCSFPIKAMGNAGADFRETVIEIVARHAGLINDDAIRSMPSRNGKFISITVTIDATSQDQLDAIYQDLSAHHNVIVSL